MKLRAWISPDHPLRVFWESIQLLMVGYYHFHVPLSIAYDVRYTTVTAVTDMCFLAVFVLDFALRKVALERAVEGNRFDPRSLPDMSYFNFISRAQIGEESPELVHVNEEPQEQRRWPRILLSAFLEGVVIFPYSLLGGSDASVQTYLRIPRLLTVARIPLSTQVVFDFLEAKGLVVLSGIKRLIKLWFVFLWFAHMMSCGFFMIAMALNVRGHANWAANDGLLQVNATLDEAFIVERGHAYVRTLYWAIITMVTVGLGDITPENTSYAETVYCILTIYTGMIMSTYIIGNLTDLVANLDAAEDDFYRKLENVDKYMTYRKLSHNLRHRIKSYYKYLWKSLKGVDEQQFLNDLTVNLRLEVVGLRTKDLVEQIGFLRNQGEPLIHAICGSLEQIILSPGDVLVQAGTKLDGAYFLSRGEAEVLKKDGRPIQVLSGKQRSTVGDTSLFVDSEAENTVRARSYCELYYLNKRSFHEQIHKFLNEEEIEKMKDKCASLFTQGQKVKKFFGLEIEASESKVRWSDPTSRFREFWNVFIMCGILYNLIAIPLRVAFFYTITDMYIKQVESYVTDWILDIFFLLDVFFRARHFSFYSDGLLIRDRGRIFTEYCREDSTGLDLFMSIPLDLGSLLVDPKNSLPFFRVPKLFHIIYLQRHYMVLKGSLEKRGVTLTNAGHRIIKTFFFVLIFIHWTGCLWILGAILSYRMQTPLCENSNSTSCRNDWITNDFVSHHNGDHLSSAVIYLRGAYFVMVDMTTVGYGDIVPINTLETVIVAVVTVIGGFVYPAVVGAIAALISNLNMARAEFTSKIVSLQRYMEVKQFPTDLRTRILRFYDYLWSRQRGVDENGILNDMPEPLRKSVQEYVNGEVLRNVQFFRRCNEESIQGLLGVLQPSVFLPGDMIAPANQLGDSMFLIERGATKVTAADGKRVFAILSTGDYFGEASLLAARPRNASITAISYCDCFSLAKTDFDQVFAQHPEEKAIILEDLRKVLTQKSAQNQSIDSNHSRFPKLQQITSSEDAETKTLAVTALQHPDSKLREIWDVLLLFTYCYNIFVVPYRVSFEGPRLTRLIDYSLDILVFLDTYLRATWFAFLRAGEIVSSSPEIKSNYKASRGRYYDIMAVIPFECLVIFTLAQPSLNSKVVDTLWAIARVPKLAMLFHLPARATQLDKFVKSRGISPERVTYKLVKLFALVLLVSHLFACVFYLVAIKKEGCIDEEQDDLHPAVFAEGFCPMPELFFVNLSRSVRTCGTTRRSACTWEGTWVELQMKWGLLPIDGGTQFQRYLRALNWAIPTLVVVVIGDVVPVSVAETVVVAFGILLGVIVNANIIGNIANLVANLEGAEAVYARKIDKLENFLRTNGISPLVQENVRSYYEYMWETKKGFNENEILAEMPYTLGSEASSFLRLQYISTNPIFKHCDVALQRAISYALKLRVYSPSDFVIMQGDLGAEMFFVNQGTVQILAMPKNWRASEAAVSSAYQHKPSIEDGGMLLSTRGPGEFFGETSMFLSERRGCSAVALDYTELYVLSQEELEQVLLRFPVALEEIKSAILELQEANAKLSVNIEKNRQKHGKLGGKLWRHLAHLADQTRAATMSLQTMHNFGGRTRRRSHQHEEDEEGIRQLRSFSKSHKVQPVEMEPNRGERKPTRVKVGLREVNRAKFDKKVKELEKTLSRRRKSMFSSEIFLPFSKFVSAWHVFSLLALIYYSFSLPFRLAFLVDGKYPLNEGWPTELMVWIAFDYVVDAFCLVDIVLRSRYIAVYRFGTLLTQPNELWKEYRRNGMVIDIAASIPLEVVLVVPGFRSNGSLMLLYSLLKMGRLLRLYHLFDYIAAVIRLVQLHIDGDRSTVQVLKLLLLVILWNHWYACGWFLIHRFLERNVHNTWAIVDGLATYNETSGMHNVMNDSLSPGFCYLRSFYFVIVTMSSVGYGDIRPYTIIETIFENIVVVSGACSFAALIGLFAVVCFTTDSKGLVAFKNQVKKYKEYMKYRELPKELQDRILRHLSSLWVRENGVKFEEIRRDIPLPLQLQLAISVHKKVLKRVALLRQCHLHVQRHIARLLRLQINVAGEYVYRIGDIGREIYFVYSGEVLIQQRKGNSKKLTKRRAHASEHSQTVKPGRHFGHDIIRSVSGARRESAVCLTDAELYYIDKNDLEGILLQFPDHIDIGIFHELFKDEAAEPLRQRLNERRFTIDRFEVQADKAK